MGPTRSTSPAAPAGRSRRGPAARNRAGDRRLGGAPARALARRTGGSIEAVTDDEIRAGIRLLAETTGVFTETAGGVTAAVLAKLAERGEIDADERVVVYITGEGLKTLDAVRDTFT